MADSNKLENRLQANYDGYIARRHTCNKSEASLMAVIKAMLNDRKITGPTDMLNISPKASSFASVATIYR